MLKRFVAITSCALATGLAASAATASCLLMTPAQQRARASLIFDAVALDGPTSSGVERFRVTRYIKGAGPEIVRVKTGRIRRAQGGGVVTSVSIDAARGETWRIYARRVKPGLFQTTVCDGSRRLRRRGG